MREKEKYVTERSLKRIILDRNSVPPSINSEKIVSYLELHL